jgi:hypothetical protein
MKKIKIRELKNHNYAQNSAGDMKNLMDYEHTNPYFVVFSFYLSSDFFLLLEQFDIRYYKLEI